MVNLIRTEEASWALLRDKVKKIISLYSISGEIGYPTEEYPLYQVYFSSKGFTAHTIYAPSVMVMIEKLSVWEDSFAFSQTLMRDKILTITNLLKEI